LDVAADSELTVGALIKRAPLAVTESTSLRAITNIMVQEGVGRLPMLSDKGKVVGIITRSDLISAQRKKPAPSANHSHAGH
jgi:CBS domain-containing protein